MTLANFGFLTTAFLTSFFFGAAAFLTAFFFTAFLTTFFATFLPPVTFLAVVLAFLVVVVVDLVEVDLFFGVVDVLPELDAEGEAFLAVAAEARDVGKE